MRKYSLVALILVALTATFAFAHFPDKIKIDEAQSKQPAVNFDHAKHAEKLAKDCGVCHHTQKDITKQIALDNKVDIKKCSTCHLNPAKADMPSAKEMSMTKNPYHIRCIGCHKEGKKGPTVCNQCHVKA